MEKVAGTMAKAIQENTNLTGVTMTMSEGHGCTNRVWRNTEWSVEASFAVTLPVQIDLEACVVPGSTPHLIFDDGSQHRCVDPVNL